MMNFKSSVLLSVLMSAALVSAVPLSKRGHSSTMMMPVDNTQATSLSAGAAYCQSLLHVSRGIIHLSDFLDSYHE